MHVEEFQGKMPRREEEEALLFEVIHIVHTSSMRFHRVIIEPFWSPRSHQHIINSIITLWKFPTNTIESYYRIICFVLQTRFQTYSSLHTVGIPIGML